eukprot:TRINITY_DN4142_c0_g1_i1.p1 TRINITY_DN4142_c0_g1~~TRINITY_DN4142_c0_g1_i1.p1  ORF type:complete len:287 (+),score=93.82 TRINITY_DN4142_c0_g1_i1:37-861(+)
MENSCSQCTLKKIYCDGMSPCLNCLLNKIVCKKIGESDDPESIKLVESEIEEINKKEESEENIFPNAGIDSINFPKDNKTFLFKEIKLDYVDLGGSYSASLNSLDPQIRMINHQIFSNKTEIKQQMNNVIERLNFMIGKRENNNKIIIESNIISRKEIIPPHPNNKIILNQVPLNIHTKEENLTTTKMIERKTIEILDESDLSVVDDKEESTEDDEEITKKIEEIRCKKLMMQQKIEEIKNQKKEIFTLNFRNKEHENLVIPDIPKIFLPKFFQ